MGRMGLCALAVLAATGTAAAGPKKKVKVESSPAGASVYIDDLENGELCKTPCSVEVEAGATLILSLAGHKPELQPVTFGRRERPPYKRSFTLTPAIGKVLVKEPRGATVSIDDEDKGKAPVEVEVVAGSHTIVLTLDGKTVHEEIIDVVANDELTIKATPKKTAEPDPDDPPDEDPEPEDPPIGVVKPGTPKPPRAGSIVALSLAGSVGFRNFEYQNVADGADLKPESEGGQVIVGPVLELWPGTLAGIRALRGLAIVGRAQFGVNSQEVSNAGSARTFWGSYEVSLRQQWRFGAVGVEAGAGYVQDQHSFEGDVGDIAKVPDATYQSVKLAGRLSYQLGSVEPYAAFENRVVMSGGNLQERFEMAGFEASTNGIRVLAGAAAAFGKIGVRVEGSLTRYAWDFSGGGADGATDSIKLVSFGVGYAY